jgi:hypothetical protein
VRRRAKDRASGSVEAWGPAAERHVRAQGGLITCVPGKHCTRRVVPLYASPRHAFACSHAAAGPTQALCLRAHGLIVRRSGPRPPSAAAAHAAKPSCLRCCTWPPALRRLLLGPSGRSSLARKPLAACTARRDGWQVLCVCGAWAASGERASEWPRAYGRRAKRACGGGGEEEELEARRGEMQANGPASARRRGDA